MDKVEYNAAAQILARTVTLAVIFVRVPVGQPLANACSYRGDIAQQAFVQHRAYSFISRVKTEVITNHCHKVFAFYSFENILQAVHRRSDRLFNENMTAGLRNFWECFLLYDRRGADDADI